MIMEILKLLAKRGQLVPLCEQVMYYYNYGIKQLYTHINNSYKLNKLVIS